MTTGTRTRTQDETQTTTKTETLSVPTVALSVCQPWAWAIASGYKRVENRTWSTKYRGPIAIHASSSTRQCNLESDNFMLDSCQQVYDDMMDDRACSSNQLFYLGHIIGTAEVVGCVEVGNVARFDRIVEDAGFGDWLRDDKHVTVPGYWAEGTQCWLLSNAVEFTEPIQCKGALNLWKLSVELQLACRKELTRHPRIRPMDFVEMKQKAAIAAKVAAEQATTYCGPRK